MTKEEIIKGLESVKKECGMHLDESFAWICEPIDGAIKALEQQSENCVVEDLIKEVSEQESWLSDAGYNAYNVDIAFKSITRAIQNTKKAR